MKDLLESDYKVDTQGIKRYAKGNSLGKPAGSFAEYSGQGGPPITTDNAHEMLALRESQRLRAWEEELAAHPDARTSQDGLRLIANAQLILATDPDAGHASTEAAKFYLRAGGYMRDVKQVSAAVVNVLVHVGDGLAGRYGSPDAEDVIVSSEEGE